jgi:hypothetical protein
MTTERATWFVHEDAVDDPTPMDITVRAKAGEAGEIVLCYMGPGLTGTLEEARNTAHWLVRLLNELNENSRR